ncbi:20S proteasome subunit beta 2 [Saprolegnia diclina VS20]|uniref:Proteasome subunit beta n=1 Tax=Saprolegnia diclina (strain VS20) TaxID=1156394 RepID=T0QNR7_SAPDV|nr:20S proteasome subunit beta 2 [Saprolegnia diclina VS20]EQC36371.1 20S proteasome subunit beta 2 [Saprolegnia diclina VS20]|eukprot:XP_008610477.1 20S proteasome subunit beta 2 [Saprolegnia diclina VS20]
MSEFRNTTGAEPTAFATASADVGGFSFENVRRNEFLAAVGATSQAKFRVQKTGTTIVGVVYKDGVVLGADTRSTGGSIVMDKNCEKIHYIAPNIWCCGAGTAADTENVTQMISSQLELHRLNTDTSSRVATAMTLLKQKLFQYQGHLSAALVLGGVDVNGPSLYTIYPHGSTDRLPFVTMGSGSLAAMSIFEAGYKDDMTEAEAKKLVQDAILAGVFNDLGSGSNVDVLTIKKVNNEVVVEKEFNCITPNNVAELRSRVNRNVVTSIPRGATRVIRQHYEPMVVVEDGTPMDL